MNDTILKEKTMKKAFIYGLLFTVLVGGINANANANLGIGVYQFASKLYTEALGKGPDINGWLFWVEDFLGEDGVTTEKLAMLGIIFYTSEEFYNIYDNDYRSMLLALYRGCFSREPDYDGFIFWLSKINNLYDWSLVVNAFFQSPAFKNEFAEAIISNQFVGWHSNSPVISIQDEWTSSELQNRINEAVENETYLVEIPQNTVIRVGQDSLHSGLACIVVHENVTLRTQGLDENYNAYAKMARIVRSSFIQDGLYSGELVALKSGAKLEGIWIDGQRNIHGYDLKQINVFMTGNHNLDDNPTTIVGCRISNTCGWTQLQSLNDYNYYEYWGMGTTSKIDIRQNLVTNYSGSHCLNLWSDGLSIGTSEGSVRYNMIIDPTDVGIVVYSNVLHPQNTQIYENCIVNISNSAFSGIAADTNHRIVDESFSSSGVIKGTYQDPLPMQTLMENNYIWTSQAAHINIAIAVGSGTWWHDGVVEGIIAQNNTVGSIYYNANVGIGIAISGVVNPIVQHNQLFLELGNYTRESFNIGVDLSFYPQGEMPFNIQDNFELYDSMLFFVINDQYNLCE